VAEWNAALRKTDVAVVRTARGLAWSWVRSSTLVNRLGGCLHARRPPLSRYPVWESEQDDVPDAAPHSATNDGASHGRSQP